MFISAALELEPDVHFRMAQEGNCDFPCTFKPESLSCIAECGAGDCPGLTLKLCVTQPKKLNDNLHRSRISAFKTMHRDGANNK